MSHPHSRISQYRDSFATGLIEWKSFRLPIYLAGLNQCCLPCSGQCHVKGWWSAGESGESISGPSRWSNIIGQSEWLNERLGRKGDDHLWRTNETYRSSSICTIHMTSTLVIQRGLHYSGSNFKSFRMENLNELRCRSYGYRCCIWSPFESFKFLLVIDLL